jgi:pilus assembly protein Flp/PilA
MDINLAATQHSLPSARVPDQSGNNGSRDSRSDSHVWTSKELDMTNLIKCFVKDESGATAIEYGLIAAGISVAIIAVVQGLGSKLNTTFTSVQTALK